MEKRVSRGRAPGSVPGIAWVAGIVLLVAGVAILAILQMSGGSSRSPGTAAGNPFLGERFYVDPGSNAGKQADEWWATRPEDAAQMDKIAAQPSAYWFGDGETNIKSAVGKRVSTIEAAGALPVLVAYYIPHRDCGGYSAGGAATPEAYIQWINGFAGGVGNSKAVVVLEPDALASMGCLSASDQETRIGLIKEAVNVFKNRAAIAVYLDAGHPRLQPAAEMASRLGRAGIAQADGFSLNVSNFFTVDDLLPYGKDISQRTGGKHFIIDTSRDGLGPTPDYQWCNPPGRALGPAPTTQTADPLVDAYFWIKPPGESDGTCNGGPKAGEWWPEYALGLAQRAKP